MKITVSGTGYVGLSLAVLLAQNHQVTAVDILPEKVKLINDKKSPLRDEYIENYLLEKELNLTATLDEKTAYEDADFVIVAVPVIAKMDSTSQSLIAGIVLIASMSGMTELNTMLPMNMLKTRILNCIRLF